MSNYYEMGEVLNRFHIPLDKSFMFICMGPRNIGKSTGTWNWIIKNIWEKSNYEDKVAYLRTNFEKSKYWVKSFNSKYYLKERKYIMVGAMIYKVAWDEDGKEILSQRKEIGSIVTVNNEENFKSGIFDNYRCVFWDEFNDEMCGPLALIEQKQSIFEKAMSLLKTIKRMTDPFYIILQGNKIDSSNDILVNLELDLRYPDKTYFEHKDKGNIYFYNVGVDEYADLNPEDDIVNQLATYNDNTNAYMNKASYLRPIDDQVILYNKYIKPTREIVYYLTFAGIMFEYGKFDNDKIYVHIVRSAEPDTTILALDMAGYINQTQSYSLWDEIDYEELADYWKEMLKEKKMFYTTYRCKKIFEVFIIKMGNMIDN